MRNIWDPWEEYRRYGNGSNRFSQPGLCANGKSCSALCRYLSLFDPLRRNAEGRWLIRSGETLLVRIAPDFFHEQTDAWREEAWSVMRSRPDVIFVLMTERPYRIVRCLPDDWNHGWEHVFLHVICENQKTADERLPFLLKLPFLHKGILVAPISGPVSVEKYLKSGKIEQVLCGGDNRNGALPCDFGWVKLLHDECARREVHFRFTETGSVYIRDGMPYHISDRLVQAQTAFYSNLHYEGRRIRFQLRTPDGFPIPEEDLFVSRFRQFCLRCPSMYVCNGCECCGKCAGKLYTREELFKKQEQFRINDKRNRI